MSELEKNRARMLAALTALESRVAALRDTDATLTPNQDLEAKISALEAKVHHLSAAGEEAVRDLDQALDKLTHLTGETHG